MTTADDAAPGGAPDEPALPEPATPDPGSDALIDAADVPGVVPGVVADGEPAEDDAQQDAEIDPAAERRALLELLVYAWDRARSPGVHERLAAGLAGVGVSVLRPDGEPYDPTRHEVGGVQPTEDEALLGTVAETELVGFADRGAVLREPVVVVYRNG